MTKLYEILAAESSVKAQADKSLAETEAKFKKEVLFQGHTKTLQHLVSNPENEAREAQFKENKPVATTVFDTLQYSLNLWAKLENLLATKNTTNCSAMADLTFRGRVVATQIPVDELMGLEARLTKLRGILQGIPTLDASQNWENDVTKGPGYFKTTEDAVTLKTERVIETNIVVQATDKFPAQVKESSRDAVVGTIVLRKFSGAATTYQLAETLTVVDELIVEVKQARNRANAIDVAAVTIGDTIASIILAPLDPAPTTAS